MTRKKTMIIITLMTALFTILVGCSGNKKEIKDFDMQSLVDKLLANINFKDSLTKAQDHIVANLYMFDEEDIASSIVYVGSGATVEEIAIFKASSKEKTTDIEKAIKTRIKDQKDAFSTYNPEEIKKLENYTFITQGSYVILCISDENDKATKIINDFIN